MSLQYFRRRLNETQRWSDAPPAVRYHAAASNVDDDVLERSGEPFGAPYGESGFGTSEVMQELMSKDPKYVPVTDLAEYQQGLIDTGYLPSSFQATGQWDEASANADRRASRDAFNATRSGGSWGSASVKTLFRYLGYTLPTSVFDGLYGIAQGIVSDAARAATNPVEVFEEGGLAGGAAVGAGVGAGIGTFILPGIGTGVGAVGGAVVGGVAGFFGDLFDDDEDEDGDWNRIVGALSPIDEIRSGDAKNLFAALSTIMTASAVLKAGKVAHAGIKAAGGTKQLALRDGWRMAARDEVSPGILNQIAQAGIKHRTWGAAAVGGTANAAQEFATTGDLGQALRDFGTGALVGAVAGKSFGKTGVVSKASEKAIKVLDAAPLARIHASGAGQVLQAGYTGLAAPTIITRGVSELSGGETAIGEDIREADIASKLGTTGTVLDWTVGTMVFPSRLLPWKADDLVVGMKAMGSNHALLAHAAFLRSQKPMSQSAAIREVRERYGKNADGNFDEFLLGQRVNDDFFQHGREIRAEAAVQQHLADLPQPKNAIDRLRRDALEGKFMEEERAKINELVMKQVGESGDLPTSPLGRELVELGMSDQHKMANFLATKDYNFDHAVGHKAATEHLNEARSHEMDFRESGLIEKEMDRLMANDPSLTFEDAFAQVDQFALRDAVKGFDKEYTYTPAVKDEYLVAQDFEKYGGIGGEVGEYEAAATRWKQAADALEDADDTNLEQLRTAHGSAAEELDGVLVQMKDKGIIDSDLYDAMRPIHAKPDVDKSLIKYLKETAKMRPRRNDELTDELAAITLPDGTKLDRYMAVTTGPNIIDYTHFQKQAAIEGIKEYSAKKNFFDAVASLGVRIDTQDIGKLRYNSIIRHLDKTVGEVFADGAGMTGRRAADGIYDEMKNRYSPEWLKRNRGEKIEMRGNIVRREDVSGKVSRELFKIDPRDLDAEDIIKALDLEASGILAEGKDVYEAANTIKRSLHVGAAFGADVVHPLATARSLGASLRVNGLTGFNDFMRTTTIVPTKLVSKMPAKFKKGSYGYIPQHLRRFHMALQFSLSPTFDASRIAEAITFGKIRGGDVPLKIATNAKKFVHEFEEGWIHPETGQRVFGQEAVDAMVAFGDRAIYGRAVNKNFDTIQLELLHRGVLGYKPRDNEYGIAWWQAQKKARKGPLSQEDLDEIRETVLRVTQYGTKRTAIGNTAHFIFFPYLFSQKQVAAMVDFTLGAPGRNLLAHEGVRRWYEVTGEDGTSMSEDFAKFMEKHIPLAEELGRINNLAYGVSPGRFFLEGFLDKSEAGKVGQGLASFFLPGGVHQAVADTVGAGAEQLKNFFVPQVWTDATYDALGGQKGTLGLAERLIPAYRDLDRWFFDSERSGSPFGMVGAQVQATLGKGAPRAQMSEYIDAKKVMSTALDTLATQSGYSSWESLRGSRPELAPVIDEMEGELGQKYPEGMRLANEFTNKDGLKEQYLYDIAEKISTNNNPTSAEIAISTIGAIETQVKALAAQTGRTQTEMLRLVSPAIRAYASQYATDRQFINLWEGLFRGFHGPLREIEVA